MGVGLAGLQERVSGASSGRKRRRALEEAQRELHRLQGERRALADEEDRLGTLREELADARAAGAELLALQHALERADKLAEIEAVGAELLSLPAPPEQMARLTGRVIERLVQLDVDLEAARTPRAEARGDRALAVAHRVPSTLYSHA